jgi:superfamily II DNA helicase RecQ
VIDGNPARQLLVPSGPVTLEVDADAVTWVVSDSGKWRVAGPGVPQDKSECAVRLPASDDERAPEWIGAATLRDPAEVLESLDGQFQFVEGTADGSRRGLRTPQIGAVHAVLGYWATVPSQPATVVMPTGTGKTDTMIALFAAVRPQRLLVIVPTDALRSQLARKFETYGVLMAAGALREPVARPVVGTVEHAFSSKNTAIAFAERCNIIVSTVSALLASSKDIRRALVDECSHLFVDEAHHIVASQWSDIRDYFADRKVVQFTATPFLPTVSILAAGLSGSTAGCVQRRIAGAAAWG